MRSKEGLKATNLRGTTKDNYSSVTRTHLIPTLGHLRLDRLAPSHIDTLLVGMRKRGLSDSTVRLTYTVARRALDYAMRDGLVRTAAAAAVARPTVDHREAAVLSPEEAQKLLEASRGHRLYALYAVAMAVGIRRGEALALHWSDVDPDAGTVRVYLTLLRSGGSLHFTDIKTPRSRRKRHKRRQRQRRAERKGWEDERSWCAG